VISIELLAHIFKELISESDLQFEDALIIVKLTQYMDNFEKINCVFCYSCTKRG
jgi:hypothetical protein